MNKLSSISRDWTVIALLTFFGMAAGGHAQTKTSARGTNSLLKPRATQTVADPKLVAAYKSLAVISNNVALITKQMDGFKAKHKSEIERLRLRRDAKELSQKEFNDAAQSLNQKLNGQIDPLEIQLNKCKLQAYDIRKGAGLPEPGKLRRY